MTIKQTKTWTCMACVGAMITGETEQAFIDFIGHDGEGKGKLAPCKLFREDAGFTWQEMAVYLLAHGYTLGLLAYGLSKEYKVEFPILVEVSKDCKIILEVHSKLFMDERHVVYWDGKQLHDSSPDAPSDWTLDDYKILSITPVVQWQWHDDNQAVKNFLERIRGKV